MQQLYYHNLDSLASIFSLPLCSLSLSLALSRSLSRSLSRARTVRLTAYLARLKGPAADGLPASPPVPRLVLPAPCAHGYR